MTNPFKAFPPIGKKEWLAKIEKDLKGKPITALDWQLNPLLTISPFAHADDIHTPFLPISSNRKNNAWEIGTSFPMEDKIASVNEKILEALNGGIQAIALDITTALSEKELAVLLKNIRLDWISTHFIFQLNGEKTIAPLLSFLEQSSFDTTSIRGSFSFDNEFDLERDRLLQFRQILPNFNPFTINGQVFHTDSTNTTTEIAQIIHTGNQALSTLNKVGFDLSTYSSKMQFSITVGDSYFLNIAKIRALKLLWQQILDAWELPIQPPVIQVYLNPTNPMKDIHYNKIKATAQAMSAISGGIQRLFIAPSDATDDSNGTSFAQRIAWNIQHLMQLESYMDQVMDPAAGSYYLEQLTNQLAEQAWMEFQNKY